ncbi:MAG: hypothetical protein MJ065_06525 [Oscillospiraceae bacterium]|nr:hypothetical protein [Oscillospiraceae bacterium]
MFIVWGTREKLKKDISTGIDWCPVCKKFTGWYIGRHVKINHVEYIPLKTQVLEYFMMCGICQHGPIINPDIYSEFKQMFEPFKKRKQQIQCFEKAAKMAETMAPNEISVNTIMDALASEYPIRSSQQLEIEYRRRIQALLLTHGIGGDPNALIQPKDPQLPPKQPAVMDTI